MNINRGDLWTFFFIAHTCAYASSVKPFFTVPTPDFHIQFSSYSTRTIGINLCVMMKIKCEERRWKTYKEQFWDCNVIIKNMKMDVHTRMFLSFTILVVWTIVVGVSGFWDEFFQTKFILWIELVLDNCTYPIELNSFFRTELIL